MRFVVVLCVVLLAAASSGCAIIEAEKYNRGGYLDRIADDHWMKADSKRMRALRALAIEVSLARIAMIAPKSAPDRALLARRIGETSKRADVVRRCAFAREPVIVGQLRGEPCFFFDSVMVDYENALFDLALLALPINEARTLLTKVAGGAAAVSLNPLQLVEALIDLGREAFRYGRVVGSIYRDTIELEVQVWLASPQFADQERARGVPEEFIVTYDRVARLAAIYVRGNDNIPAWLQEIAALRAQQLEPVPHDRFIVELYDILRYICSQIVSKDDPAYRECVFEPKSIALTGGLAGDAPRPGASGRGGGRLEPANGRTGSGKPAEPEGAQSKTERELTHGEVKTLKLALCIKAPDTESYSLDAQMREALRQFVAGQEWKDTNGASPTIDPVLKTQLNDAAKLFPSCQEPITNAYELGAYSRKVRSAAAGIENVKQTLRQAITNLRLPNQTDDRAAIAALRAHFESASPPLAAVAEGAKRQLDGKLWPRIVTGAPAPSPTLPGAPR